MNDYPHDVMRAAETKSMLRHLWYFSERLVTLAFFNVRVTNKTKESMVKNLQNPTTTNLTKLNGKDFDCTVGLENCVTRMSMCFFDLIEANGQNKAKSFLSQLPSTWLSNKNCTDLKLAVDELKVVNDTAKRRVALIQAYSGSLTRDEEQPQYLLQVITAHRQAVSQSTKSYLI